MKESKGCRLANRLFYFNKFNGSKIKIAHGSDVNNIAKKDEPNAVNNYKCFIMI